MKTNRKGKNYKKEEVENLNTLEKQKMKIFNWQTKIIMKKPTETN